jgi:hypothetical protein
MQKSISSSRVGWAFCVRSTTAVEHGELLVKILYKMLDQAYGSASM